MGAIQDKRNALKSHSTGPKAVEEAITEAFKAPFKRHQTNVQQLFKRRSEAL